MNPSAGEVRLQLRGVHRHEDGAYNFIKIHRTLRTRPAMAADVTDRLWEYGKMADLVCFKRCYRTEQRAVEKRAAPRGAEALDDCIAKAKLEKRSIWVKVLSRHASVISDSMGDLALTRGYVEQVLAYEPEDAFALFKLADVLFGQGQADLAKRMRPSPTHWLRTRARTKIVALLNCLPQNGPKSERGSERIDSSPLPTHLLTGYSAHAYPESEVKGRRRPASRRKDGFYGLDTPQAGA